MDLGSIDELTNGVLDWALAPGVAATAFIILLVARLVARHWAPDPSDPRLGHALVARVLRGTRWPLLLLLALYVASLTLPLRAEVEAAAHAVAVLTLLVQVGLWGGEMIAFFAQRYQQRSVEEERTVSPGTVYALRFIGMLTLWSILLLLALENLGVEVTALVAGLGIGGIAIALAAQSVLGDLFASLTIVLDRPFEVGDFIIVGDMLGTVEHVGIKTTRIRSLSGEQLIFANNDLVSSRIRNFKRMEERRVVFQIGMTYDTPAELVERAPGLIREAIEQQSLTRFDRSHFNTFGNFALNIESVYYVLNPDYNVYMDVHQAINLEILRRFREAGIEFAFPTQTVHLYDQVMARRDEAAARP